MPTMTNYLNFIYVNLGFIAQIAVMMFFKSAIEIRQNWPVYRCNPPYWVFSENISEDFNYCVQNTQVNLMGYLLQPMNYLISSLASMSSSFNESINQIRVMTSGIRGFVSNIIESVFGVFLNMIIEFQKMIISIKDMVGKMIGIVVTIMYVLDGSIKTMGSAWNGPPGQLVKALGSCFHPDTLVELKDGTSYKMKDLPLGSILKDNSKVFSVMKIMNDKKEDLYKIETVSKNGPPIYVTGDHFIFDKVSGKWTKVKNYKYATLQKDVKSEWFSCLITSSRHIPIGGHLFWDWEDDELANLKNIYP